MPKIIYKILIAEDETYLAEMYKMKFEQGGYIVFSASNGREAVEIAKREMPDLILLDVLMPILNGYQVLEELKKNVATKNIKIYFLSNLSQTDEMEAGMKKGANGYLVKASLTPSQVLDKINDVFKK